MSITCFNVFYRECRSAIYCELLESSRDPSFLFQGWKSPSPSAITHALLLSITLLDLCPYFSNGSAMISCYQAALGMTDRIYLLDDCRGS